MTHIGKIFGAFPLLSAIRHTLDNLRWLLSGWCRGLRPFEPKNEEEDKQPSAPIRITLRPLTFRNWDRLATCLSFVGVVMQWSDRVVWRLYSRVRFFAKSPKGRNRAHPSPTPIPNPPCMIVLFCFITSMTIAWWTTWRKRSWKRSQDSMPTSRLTNLRCGRLVTRLQFHYFMLTTFLKVSNGMRSENTRFSTMVDDALREGVSCWTSFRRPPHWPPARVSSLFPGYLDIFHLIITGLKRCQAVMTPQSHFPLTPSPVLPGWIGL